MSDWSLEITKAKNGYICTHWEYIEDEHVKQQVVFEDTEQWKENCEVEGELHSLKGMLHYIVEYFGQIGSKHDKHRIKVNIDHQHDTI